MRLAVELGVAGTIRAGIARYIESMLQRLVRIRPNWQIVLYSPHRTLPVSIEKARVRIDSSFTSKFGQAWLHFRLPLMLRQDGADVVWCQNHFVPRRADNTGVRVVTIHDLTALVLPRSMPVRTRVWAGKALRRAAALADAVVADSEATARLIKRLLVPRSSSVTVVYPTLPEPFRPTSATTDTLDQSRKLTKRSPFLLFVGTVEPRKGVDLLLTALEMRPDLPPLILVGNDGWRSQAICVRAERLAAIGRVQRIKNADDNTLRELYRNALLLICPSIYEGFGLPVLEAMSAGCPVLCSWSSSLPEVGGSAARYFKVGSIDDLLRQLDSILNDSKELERMAVSGMARARLFDCDSAAEKLARVFEAAATHAKPTKWS